MAGKTFAMESRTTAASVANQDNQYDTQNDDDSCFSSDAHNVSSSLLLAGSLAWVVTEFHNFFSRAQQQRQPPQQSSSLQSRCDETRLLQDTVPYYVYPSQELVLNSKYYVENLWDNPLAHSPNVRPLHHRVDAKYEILILQALMNHSSRVHRPEDAQLFVIPVPFSTIALDGGAKHDARNKRHLYQHLFDTLREQPAFVSGKPHVLVSMTNQVFSCFTTNADRRQGLMDLYHNLSSVSVARGDDFLASRHLLRNVFQRSNLTRENATGFEHHLSVLRPVTQYTFSIGLGGQAIHIPLQIATWKKFQSSSFFIFSHTRVSQFFCDSTPYRLAPVLNVSWSSPLFQKPSSVGYDLPRDQWATEFSSSQFCLVIRGDTPHSHALFNAVQAGCIPVIISDWYPFYAPPFPTTLQLWDFSIFIPEEEFMKHPAETLASLQHIPERILRAKLKALRFAQRVMLLDHPQSLFVPAFVREAMASFDRPRSKVIPEPEDMSCPETCS